MVRNLKKMNKHDYHLTSGVRFAICGARVTFADVNHVCFRNRTSRKKFTLPQNNQFVTGTVT